MISGRITKESWDYISENLYTICTFAPDIDEADEAMKEYLEGEGIIEVITD